MNRTIKRTRKVEKRSTFHRMTTATSTLPLAVVSGADEPFVDNAFLLGLSYGALWDGRVHILAGQGHMPFWQDPALVNELLARFLSEVA